MARGESRLGRLHIAWDVPDSLPETAGGLEHLISRSGRGPVEATWSVRAGASGPPPSRHDAFFGAALVVVGDAQRIWSSEADLVVRARNVDGVASGPATVAASLALHALAAHAGLAHVHAALMRLDGRTLLAPGGSGAGKTSTALAVGRHGGELLADDTVYIDSELVAWPVRRPPHATPATLAAHPGIEILGSVRDGVIPKARVRPPGAGPARPCAVDLLLAPSIVPDGPTRVEPADGAELFPVLLGSSALAVVEGSPRRDEIIDLLAALAERPAAHLFAGPDALEDPRVIPATIRRWIASLG